MLIALDKYGNRTKPTKGATGYCPSCQEEVIAKCGTIKIWHWAHKAKKCRYRYEPETNWHLAWKSLWPDDCIEVIRGNHRADVITPLGVVIEFQNSSISAETIKERESFWGHHMIWVINATKFHKNLSFSRRKASDGFLEEKPTFKWKHERTVWQSSHRQKWLDFGSEGILLDCSLDKKWLPLLKKIRGNLDSFKEEDRLVKNHDIKHMLGHYYSEWGNWTAVWN